MGEIQYNDKGEALRQFSHKLKSHKISILTLKVI